MAAKFLNRGRRGPVTNTAGLFGCLVLNDISSKIRRHGNARVSVYKMPLRTKRDLVRQQYLVPRKSVKKLREMSRREASPRVNSRVGTSTHTHPGTFSPNPTKR
jgi:hypothetical protein